MNVTVIKAATAYLLSRLTDHRVAPSLDDGRTALPACPDTRPARPSRCAHRRGRAHRNRVRGRPRPFGPLRQPAAAQLHRRAVAGVGYGDGGPGAMDDRGAGPHGADRLRLLV